VGEAGHAHGLAAVAAHDGPEPEPFEPPMADVLAEPAMRPVRHPAVSVVNRVSRRKVDKAVALFSSIEGTTGSPQIQRTRPIMISARRASIQYRRRPPAARTVLRRRGRQRACRHCRSICLPEAMPRTNAVTAIHTIFCAVAQHAIYRAFALPRAPITLGRAGSGYLFSHAAFWGDA